MGTTTGGLSGRFDSTGGGVGITTGCDGFTIEGGDGGGGAGEVDSLLVVGMTLEAGDSGDAASSRDERISRSLSINGGVGATLGETEGFTDLTRLVRGAFSVELLLLVVGVSS